MRAIEGMSAAALADLLFERPVRRRLRTRRSAGPRQALAEHRAASGEARVAEDDLEVAARGRSLPSRPSVASLLGGSVALNVAVS